MAEDGETLPLSLRKMIGPRIVDRGVLKRLVDATIRNMCIEEPHSECWRCAKGVRTVFLLPSSPWLVNIVRPLCL